MAPIPLGTLWLPILLAAVFVFVGSSLIHMVLKWHNSEYRPVPDEAAARAALGGAAPGQYVVPHCPDHREMAKEENRRRFDEGPIALIWIAPKGLPNMGKALGLWFLFTAVVSLFVAYLASRTLPAGAHYLTVFRVTGTAAFLAYAFGGVPNSIWMGKPWTATAKDMADGLVLGLITAGTFGWLWPR